MFGAVLDYFMGAAVAVVLKLVLHPGFTQDFQTLLSHDAPGMIMFRCHRFNKVFAGVKSR